MKYQLRPYQQQASDAAVNFLKYSLSQGGLIIVPTGGGKSLILADIAKRLGSPILIFCPSKEILEQNYSKMEAIEKGISSMYSASVRQKKISTITFATIGSVKNHPDDFDVFKYVCIDEAHNVDAKGGMYEEFIHRRKGRKVLGVTATPFRLGKGYEGGSVLKFLTRTRPRIFESVLYCCQVSDLLSQGFLADLTYYDLTEIDLRNVSSNSTGSDFDDKSLIAEYERSGFYNKLFHTTMRVLHPKDGSKRKGILVFTKFTREAEILADKLKRQNVSAATVSATTKKKEREKLVANFKNGDIEVIINVGVFVVGFDYPELDTIIFARPTKSLAIWYQAVGRALRPHQGKKGWIVDLGGTYRRFGKVSDLKIGIEKPNSELWAVFSKGRKLTNTLII